MGADRRYDFVIVGGGSAGCALANRLSADPGTTVLVLEAGRSDFRIDPFIHMPAALPFPIGNRLYDWKYETDPEPNLNDRRVFHARGKVLGGSSSINGMIFQRGNPLDYERWGAEPGMKEWDYLHCLPYFKKMESCLPTGGADEWRGGDGPLVLERGPADNPLFAAFFDATVQAGYPRTDDVNGYRQEGFAKFDRNVAPRSPALRRPRLPAPGAAPQEPHGRDPRPWRRRSASRASARSASTTSAAAGCTRTAYGRRGDPLRRRDQHPAAAPALRRRRPAAARASRASRSCTTCPGVGENLQDHLEVYIQYASKQPVSIAPGLKWRKRPGIGYQWLFHRRGLGATNHFEGGGFARSNEDVDYPNLMFHFLPVAIRYDGSAPTEGHGYQVHIGPMYADTRGHVRIR